MFDSDTQLPVPSRDFPEVFAICRSIRPFLQFQILRLEVEPYDYTFKNIDSFRETSFRIVSQRRPNRREVFTVGTIHAALPHHDQAVRVRFEIHPIFLVGLNMRIPVVFVDTMNAIPQPKNLIIPVNSEADLGVNDMNIFEIQNYLLGDRMARLERSHYFDSEDDDSIHDGIIEGNHRGTRTRRRVRGEVAHRGAGSGGGGGAASPAGGEPRTPSPASAPALASTAAPVPQLSRFTITAIINQAVAEAMTCPIGMVPIDKNAAAVTTCQHVFERGNITRWLESHDTCPVCRQRTSVISV